ncbi:Cytochrome P450 86A1 [Monoraphidium neglectum]|uniref:Cytochrome P450 86A1 n=1 Tax=Monoraphidium neglectum TaxID=145388 RepID=A0A0D2JAZ9_9CHLO|nr:Cytochrome P450 86A1 [Monoraphidium neglectum]KIY96922.1 Cytochrome P450 86A1 [Monoraphidium neglectum]|eukprot:XP_013895942.1 Cytochrome P450 86A1 [Monoraphidium neglectum]
MHPEVELKILSEAEAVLGPPTVISSPAGPTGSSREDMAAGEGGGGNGGSGGAAAAPQSYERLQALRYARAVFLEGLRLHPSVPQDVKFAVSSDVLPCGTRVPAGAMVLYSAYAINRMQEFWGPDADKFR